MKRITERDLIRKVAARWNEQYPSGRGDGIYERLLALDGETATAEEVNQIIGNESWTTMSCDECSQYARMVVQVGQEPDYESATANLCGPCIRKVFDLSQDPTL